MAIACSPGAHGPDPSGCLSTGGADVPANVGQPVQIDAAVATWPCAHFPVAPGDDDTFKNDIVVGDVVRLRLLAPLLPVRIEPISAEAQPIRPERPEAWWRWQLVADRPGVHRLSIVASVVNADGTEVLLENRHIEVRLHTSGSVGYYAGRAWQGVTSFVMSAQGVVVAIAAAVSAVGGAWVARRRRRAVPPPGRDRSMDQERDPSGYL